MRQLVILDVQNLYGIWFQETELLKNIRESALNASSIVYIWDNTSGEEFSDEIPEEWDDAYHLDENDQEVQTPGFYRQFNSIIEKQYGFFRSYMDSGVSREDIVVLGKFLLKNKINDIREIQNDKELEKEFLAKFKGNIRRLYLAEEAFYLPSDFISEIINNLTSGLTLVGGGVNECLTEFSILLDVLDIEHSVNNDLTY